MGLKAFPAKGAKRNAKFRYGSWGYFQSSGLERWNVLWILGVEVDWFVGVLTRG